MQQLLDNLGINWELLLSQAVNFALLLIVLRIFVYKPVLKLLRDRRERIEGGLIKADEAELPSPRGGCHWRGKIKEAEHEAINILKRTESEAKTLKKKFLPRRSATRKKRCEALPCGCARKRKNRAAHWRRKRRGSCVPPS